ncbi:MAG TPA: S1 RNA-binding domain-containing protein [Bacteroidetes bacterium]|nr:S1 RNA-binding domain-containing protein [Bacteroidota bacterium]
MTDTKVSKMEELLTSADQPVIPKVGDVVDGSVINVSTNEVHVDIDGLTTGVVRGRELIDESGTYSDLNVGDAVQATVLEIENESGHMELSFRQAGHQKAWNELEDLMKSTKVVAAPVTEANRGGLMIKVGNIEGFLPVSQLTVEHYPRVEGGDKSRILELLNKFIGTELSVKVIDVDEADSKLIVSEKAAWEEKQQKVISKYGLGDEIDGRVTGVVDFGAFIEFGDNLEGLVHISELAWQRIDSPKDYIKVGDSVRAKIISIDGSRISLSMKALMKDPWQEATAKYKVGDKVKGTVLKVNPFGAFIELDKDIHGLAHISELSNDRINDPTEVVKIGSDYTFRILSIEPENHRLGLSLKAPKVRSPKEEPKEKLKAEEKVDPDKDKKIEEKEEKKSEEKKEKEIKKDEKDPVRPVSRSEAGETSLGEEKPEEKKEDKK